MLCSNGCREPRAILWGILSAACAVAGLPGTATAVNECGPGVMGGTVTCNAMTLAGNALDADGITYLTSNMSLVIDAGIAAELVRNGGNAALGSLSIEMNGSVTQTALTGGLTNGGIWIETATAGGDVTLTGNGSVSASAANGIFARVTTGLATVDFDGAVMVTAAAGANRSGILARAISTGAVEVTLGGSVTMLNGGMNVAGIRTLTTSGSASVVIDGSLTTMNAAAQGVQMISGTGALDAQVNGTVMAAGSGLRTTSTSGDITIGVNAGASVLANSAAIIANTAGTVGITIAGQVDSNGSDSILVVGNPASASVAILSGGQVGHLGLGLGVTFNTGAASAVAVDNAGQLFGALASTAQVTATNSGVFRGHLFWSGGTSGSSFTNESGGVWEVTRNSIGPIAFVQDFGGTGDFVDNQAGAVIRFVTHDAADSFTAFGLERLRNAGRMTMADLETGGGAPAAGDRVRLQGDYESAGGSLAIDVTLGSDMSLADRLVIDGDALDAGGPTLVEVVNDGGSGAATTGNGILVIEVGGSSAATAFTLAAPVSAGIFDYDLVLQADGNWYLVSSLTASARLPYAIAPASALAAWHSGNGALDERLGELRWLLPAYAQEAELGAGDWQQAHRPGAGGTQPLGLWLRFAGARQAFDGSVGTPFDLDSMAVLAGADIGLRTGAGLFGDEGLAVLGLFGGTLDARADAEGDFRSELTGYSVGGYASYLDGGFYFDALVKLDSGEIEQSSGALVYEDSLDVLALGAKLEAGYRVRLGSGYFLEPQAELAFVHAWLDGAVDLLGDPIRYRDTSSLRGRLGGRGGLALTLGSVQVQPYLEASLVYEFLADSAAATAFFTDRSDLGGTSVEVGGGISVAAPGQNLALFLDADYVTGAAGQGVAVSAGLRIAF